MRRPPISSLLALLGTVVATVLAVWTAVSGMDAAAAVGGALALVLPYLFVAVALARASVWSKGLGVATAALMTWLTSFAVTEIVVGFPHGDPVRPTSVPFVVLTVLGLAIVSFGLRDLFAAVHATGYWTRTPAAARLAFVAVAYWTLVFAADTYLTASPPLGRMLLAPSLLLIDLGAALMLRQSRAAAEWVGVVLATMACLATAAYWVGYSSYLTLSGGPPIVPDLTYFTRLPWPVLLALSLALNLAIALVGTRRLFARHLRVDPRPAARGVGSLQRGGTISPHDRGWRSRWDRR
jgi:hypothetical protein